MLEQLKGINFSFGTNGKLMVLDVPILKYFRVVSFCGSAQTGEL